MADEKVSKGGVFIDTKTGKVVQSQPEEGIQLVAPGGTIDDAAQAAIDAANQPADTDKTVTTKATSSRS